MHCNEIKTTNNIDDANEENEKRFNVAFLDMFVLFCFFFSSFHFGKIKMWFHVVFYAHHMMPYRFGCRQKASNHLVRRLKLNNKHFLNMMKTTELNWREVSEHCMFQSVSSQYMSSCWSFVGKFIGQHEFRRKNVSSPICNADYSIPLKCYQQTPEDTIRSCCKLFLKNKNER